MEQEHVTGGVGQENVALGTLLHQEAYPDKARKDILIDGLLRLDFTDDGNVHEIKKRAYEADIERILAQIVRAGRQSAP